jgi:hypothetical protein
LRVAREVRCDLVFGGSGKDLNHDAGIRIDNQAPGRRSLSGKRFQDHVMYRAATTSGSSGSSASCSLPYSLPDYWAPTGAAVRKRTPSGTSPVLTKTPQGDQQLAGQRYDHGHACSATPVPGALPIPSHQSAVLLEDQEAPGELDHAATNQRVPGTRQSPRSRRRDPLSAGDPVSPA